MRLSFAQVDRACGVLIGAGAGAAVGPDGPQMIGGGLGGFATGEWTDDTAIAWAIADVAATGGRPGTERALTGIARRFRQWYDTRPPDIGNQTRSVLSAVGPEPTADTMTATSWDLHARTGHTGGSGSLMRTGPVTLAHLDNPASLAEAALAVVRVAPRSRPGQQRRVLGAAVGGALRVRAGAGVAGRDGARWALTAVLDHETLRLTPGWPTEVRKTLMHEVQAYDATYHGDQTVAGRGRCSWHGESTCEREPVISFRDGQGDRQSGCQRAAEELRDRGEITWPPMG